MVGYAGKLPLTLEPRSLSKNTEVEKCCFLILGCLPKSVRLDVATSLLEGFFGTVAVSSAGLAVLKVYELMSRHMIACSGSMAADYFREISFDEQSLVVLVSGV